MTCPFYCGVDTRRRAVRPFPFDRNMAWNISIAGAVLGVVERKGRLQVVAISGSLRRTSSNRALVEAAVRLAPQRVVVVIEHGLSSLPPFNPDLDGDDTPEAVTGFRARLQACDAILISSPEYAHGVPGVLKNGLDWLVGSGELIDKPIALINASARATHAWTSLRETLTVMSARVIPAASITVPLDGRALDANGIALDARLSAALTSALEALARAVHEEHSPPIL
jgi:chromate reductase, NAD(P)H dehydrogenase (quinone)